MGAVMSAEAREGLNAAMRGCEQRMKMTMTITDAKDERSPDIRSVIASEVLIREMKGSGVEAHVSFSNHDGIHLSWTGDGWEIEAGIERNGHFDWVCETRDGVETQSDGLVQPHDAVTTIRRLLAAVTGDGRPLAAQCEGATNV